MSCNLFEPFSKITRLNRKCVITEKIDGTNAQVFISKAVPEDEQDPFVLSIVGVAAFGWDHAFSTRAGSRNRWIKPDDDNYGFAQWVQKNAIELINLGEGRHFGEWWGRGIQRSYGLTEKRFSLFNVGRWNNPETRPKCCHVVPTLYEGDFSTEQVNDAIETLNRVGSSASTGFLNPEGVIVFHCASRQLAKVTCKNDQEPKSVSEKKAA